MENWSRAISLHQAPDLPTQLVAAFRATLEEVLDADLILHVRDIAHPETEHQAENVRGILADLGVDPDDELRLREVWNKADLLGPDAAAIVEAAARRDPRVSLVSALTGQGVDALRDAVEADLAEPAREEVLHLGFDEGRARAWLFDHHLVRHETKTDDGFDLAVRWTDRERTQYNVVRADLETES